MEREDKNKQKTCIYELNLTIEADELRNCSLMWVEMQVDLLIRSCILHSV